MSGFPLWVFHDSSQIKSNATNIKIDINCMKTYLIIHRNVVIVMFNALNMSQPSDL